MILSIFALSKKSSAKQIENEQILNYDAPKVEIIEVEVEKGFAGSLQMDIYGNSWDDVNGGSLGTY